MGNYLYVVIARAAWSSIAVVASTAVISAEAALTYTNQVGPVNTGDPGAAYDDATKAFYFGITSGDAPDGFPIYTSPNLAPPWTLAGHIFPRGTWPSWCVCERIVRAVVVAPPCMD